ncbi:putative colanic acid biosynthesis acetyltransferase [Confluentibacter lentus]|uniref:putative colanic acid biosynthesis acetyltransferase n=1 Tax=Confluentibacter lentus TaxID=1699412 RepID=UPI000C28D4EE|nr:putative colanic acid biosynthesis acetyltransferase [Confluentibacter lentus]
MQDLSLYKTPKNFRGKSKFTVQLWWLVYALFFKTSPQIFYGWRRFLLRVFGAEIGKRVVIRPTVEITYPWKLIVGDYSWIGDNVILYSLGEIEIGKNTVVSQKSYLCTGSHKYRNKDFAIFSEKITIGNSCWLATDVFVAPGVIIGKNTIVGARSSVFNSLPENKICIGNPAKPIRDRD